MTCIRVNELHLNVFTRESYGGVREKQTDKEHTNHIFKHEKRHQWANIAFREH